MRHTLLFSVLATGCMVAPDELGSSQSAVVASNALTPNALTGNALTANALTANALTANALTANGMTEGELSREMLRYIYSCALPATASMELIIDGTSYGMYYGSLGLAPEWATSSCAEDCQGWVSACVLARVNYWGITDQISLRGSHPRLSLAPDEATNFPVQEGKFWGNLFGKKPVLRDCSAQNLEDLDDDDALPLRACTYPSSPCGITSVGSCDDVSFKKVPQVITVYVKSLHDLGL